MRRFFRRAIIIIFIILLVPLCTNAGEDIEIRAKLGINDQLKECRIYLYEAAGGYYKQMPVEGWRLVRVENGDIEMHKKYCQTIGYAFSDELLLPYRWVSVHWKFYYVIASIIVASAFLLYTLKLTSGLLKEERKKKQDVSG